MADIVYQINRTVDISKGTLITMLGLCNTKDQLVQGQSYAHQINVTVENNGEPVQLTGACTANFVRQSDGSTVTVAGSVLGNVATVPFPSFVYAMVGALDITVFIGGAAILQIQTTVRLSGTMVIVDPGNILPNVEEIQQIMLNVEEALDQLTTALSNVQDATTSANDAAQKIDGLTIKANTLSAGTPASASVSLINGAYQITFGIPQGPQGIRGTTAYQGVAITGTSTTPTAYPTGIEAAIPGDLYYYNGAVPEQIGNVYMCSAGGDAETALWTFMANWRGATGAGSVSEVDGVSPGADGNVVLNAVQYAAQTLTTEQQQQARTNIGAGTPINDALATTTNPWSGSKIQSALAGKQAAITTATATLPASGWSGTGPYSQTVAVAGVTASNVVVVSPNPSNFLLWGQCQIRATTQGSGTLLFVAEIEPSENIGANIVLIEV